jgi:hypothetical protein
VRTRDFSVHPSTPLSNLGNEVGQAAGPTSDCTEQARTAVMIGTRTIRTVAEVCIVSFQSGECGTAPLKCYIQLSPSYHYFSFFVILSSQSKVTISAVVARALNNLKMNESPSNQQSEQRTYKTEPSICVQNFRRSNRRRREMPAYLITHEAVI